mgnify:CR=1 FL=1
MMIYQFIKIKECKDIIKKLNEKNSELKEENEKVILFFCFNKIF